MYINVIWASVIRCEYSISAGRVTLSIDYAIDFEHLQWILERNLVSIAVNQWAHLTSKNRNCISWRSNFWFLHFTLWYIFSYSTYSKNKHIFLI